MVPDIEITCKETCLLFIEVMVAIEDLTRFNDKRFIRIIKRVFF